MKKILIIGSEGYIGTKLGNYLTKKNYFCRGIDTGFFNSGKLSKEIYFNSENFDVRMLTKKHLKDIDVVIMLAAISNDPFGNLNPENIYDPTIDYTVKIASYCKDLGIKFIFPSSCSVYGFSDSIIDENGKLDPKTPYSLNKIQIEQELNKLSNSNFSPIALRIATVFGFSPRMRFDTVINMLCGLAITEKKILLNSNGQAWRPFVYIEDVCRAFQCCADWECKTNQLTILNVGRNDNNLKVIDIAKIISHKLNDCPIEFIYDNKDANDNNLFQDKKIQDGHDKRNYKVNFDKIHNELTNFTCLQSVEEGIVQLINDLKEINISTNTFQQKEFYRLQQIEFLFQKNFIDENLYWK